MARGRRARTSRECETSWFGGVSTQLTGFSSSAFSSSSSGSSLIGITNSLPSPRFNRARPGLSNKQQASRDSRYGLAPRQAQKQRPQMSFGNFSALKSTWPPKKRPDGSPPLNFPGADEELLPFSSPGAHDLHPKQCGASRTSQLWWDAAEKENLGVMGCHRDRVSLLYTPYILSSSTQDNTAPSCRLPSLFLGEMSKSQLFFFFFGRNDSGSFK